MKYAPDYNQEVKLQMITKSYHEFVEIYLQELHKIIRENSPNYLKKDEIRKTQQVFLQFSHSKITLKVDDFSRMLTEMR